MIFDNPFFTEMLLPFLLVFVVMFAILQKSKILGEGKVQMDAIVALVLGLILIGVPAPRNFLVGILPWLAVGVAVILVFLILYGFVAGDLSGLGSKKWVQILMAILAGVFTIGVVLYVSGWGKKIINWFSVGSEVWMNVLMVVLVLGAIVVALISGKKNKQGS